ncbi:UPF0149 family protein [Aestuariibacter salexigens]|uniref:UPF0149 family protein n=1 Tax=Aestuariibacter salexigens TaxID=226010 RepID=UPI000412A0D7|nr:UPF0149 family protein [Aestuariibacter salexigens]
MSDTNHTYEQLSAALNQNNIVVDAAEIHGILCGMLSGGMPLESREWMNALADVTNQGEALPDAVKNQVLELFNMTCQQFMDTDFALTLCLPDDAAPINERGQALIGWVQGFMLGFGLHQNDLVNCSDDVKEALQDFSDISRMDDDMSDDEESEKALFEVMEYVRISVMLCFNELGKSAMEQTTTPKSVH